MAQEITTSCTIKAHAPTQAMLVEGGRQIYIITPATTDTGDTIVITLEDFRIRNIMGVIGWVHTTKDSVTVQEQPTTAVSSGVLTITVGGSAQTDKRRAYLVSGMTRAI